MPDTTGLLAFIQHEGGIVLSIRLAERGFGRRVIDEAVRAGDLCRPRRGWIALSDADRMLIGCCCPRRDSESS